MNLPLRQADMRNRRPPGRPRTRTRTADEPTWGLIDIDRQTPEERKAREFAADQEALRLRRRLTEALPTGEPCRHKACPFPAVLEGECRQHAMDRTESHSTLPSTLAQII
jgi:hypothetical protein